MRIIKKLLVNREYKTLSQNILNLFLFQGTNYLLPLITIPYIVRVIGPEKFGILSFAEAVNYYFVLITDYGFNITGTQKISIERESRDARNRIYSIILSVKFYLLLFCLSALFLFDLLLGLGMDARIFYLYFLMVPANILLSYWFYLGMEKMHYLNFPNLVSRVLYLVLIFLFLKKADQYYFVPLFYGSSLMVGGLFSLFLLSTQFQFKWMKHSYQEIMAYFRDGWSIFISTFAINLYRKSNVFILGLVATKEAVGFYSAGEKIIVALQAVFNPIVQAFYPFIARKRKESVRNALRHIKQLLIVVGSGTAILAILFIFFAPQIATLLLGNSFGKTVIVLRVGGLVISLGVVNYIIGIIFMTNFEMKNQFSKSVIITGLTNVLVCFILSYFWEVTGTATAFIFAEFFLLCIMLIFIWKNRHLRKIQNEF